MISDKYGQKLIDGGQPEVALGLAMFATEQYPDFKEAIELQFEDPQAQEWILNNDGHEHQLAVINYKQNCVRIWQKLEDYKDMPKILRVKYFLIDWINNTYVCMFMFSMFHVILYMSDSHLRDNFYTQFRGIFSILLVHFGAIVVLLFLRWMIPVRTVDKLDQVRDLVRGQITVKPEFLFKAYEHFKKTPGVKVFAIRQKLN